MTETILVIRKWGNSLGGRLPAAVAREAKLHADQRVRISVENGRIIITSLSEVHLTLEQRLASFDPARHGGEDMQTAENRGAEK
ncbi:AbrB/MazE/SpoVT family DNA-binding domain-containing protein [Desulfomicrobium baculatum]|uniref:Transcriptional regulator/antitoxin, MazE n=1 Tax=Desulfomicrobium baculatum (strain DSM 4028 / VKM B-1378 / X) TaxID=525897 RepID=C7LSS2_DESBD|nr:AbrB/MazE/SpoVT family DNA-binding domain-containing protein [Desulfomicrobium baculatum]ACU89463.1 transcriptional regulator/antitoxin, MazE [Desulfomicrobium baculatum DSM 4028]